MKIIKGFKFRFKITNLDKNKEWQVRIYAGKKSYLAQTEWVENNLSCELSAVETNEMTIGFYNLQIYEGENTIPPKCNVFEVIDTKNGGC